MSRKSLLDSIIDLGPCLKDHHDLMIGMEVIFHDPDLNESNFGFVKSITNWDEIKIQRIYRESNLPLFIILNIQENTIYEYSLYKQLRCTCGSKYTSTKNYHLRYCDLNTKKY